MQTFKPQNGEPKQNWCKKHPTGFWLAGYKQCTHGYQRKEECIKGNVEEVKKHE